MKNRFIAAVASVLAVVLLLCSCSSRERYYGGVTERTDSDMSAYTADILPRSQDNAFGDRVTATLYYRYLSEDMLAGVEQEFDVTAENTLEEMVVQALIAGPQDSSYQFNALINPETRLVSIKEQSGYLSITLSKEFMERTDENIIADAERKRLAVQSIVNSIASIGNYSRVLLLVDKNNTGNGQRITYAEAGWEEMEEAIIEPLELDTSVILTPENVVDIVMNALVEKDYEQLEYYLASRDYDGTARPGYAEFTEVMEGKATIVGFERNAPAIVSANGTSAVATVSIKYIDAGGKTAELTTLPIRLVHEGVWKVSFLSLQTMFPEY